MGDSRPRLSAERSSAQAAHTTYPFDLNVPAFSREEMVAFTS